MILVSGVELDNARMSDALEDVSFGIDMLNLLESDYFRLAEDFHREMR